MKTLIRPLSLLFLLAFALVANAQLERIEDAIEDENYLRVVKIAEKYMEDKELKKDPRIYYYHAMGLYELAKDEFYFEDHPDAIKIAVRSVFKGLKKDNDTTAITPFLRFVDDLVVRQNELAYDQYSINKYSKSHKMYRYSYELNEDRMAYYMMGKTALLMEDSSLAESHYKNLVLWYNDDLAKDDRRALQEVDVFAYFIDKYWKEKNYDSANYYLDNGREIFGRDKKLDFYQKRIGLEQINSMPPSALMMEYIKRNVAFFPTDTNFLHKENALYIYLLKNHILSQRYMEADTMLGSFVNEKVARSNHEDVYQMQQGDEFIEKKPENVLWKLTEYFHNFRHHQSASYVLNKYIHMTASSDTPPAIAERWLVIADYTFDSKPMPFAAFVLTEALDSTDQHQDLLTLRNEVISEREGKKLSLGEMEALYALMKDEYAHNNSPENLERLQNIGDTYLDVLSQNVRFSTAKAVMAELRAYDPDKDYEEMLEYLAREDFYQNYFLSKTKGLDENGQEVNAFVWDGQISRCEEGTVAPEIQQKVLDRINYFRRNAGVPEVLFDAATNELCQKAALMMQVNNRLDHNPTRNWRCFSEDGAYAAKHSLLVQNANTSIAVTSLMADQKNPTVGNRRWLLYPNGRIYGHGSTDNVAVIWALDDSGTTDTAEYMEKPICWPPSGYVPQMMLFKHWSFSMYQDLDSATVEVVQDGKPLEVEIQKLVDGYGAPTLVFIPNYNRESLPERSSFEVKVTLSNGSNYSYTVKSFNYDPSKL